MDGPKDLEREFKKRSREIAPATPRDLQGEFTRSVRGQARAAKAADQRYFQVILGINQTYQVWSIKTQVDQSRTADYGDQGAVLTDVAEEGWRLIHTSATFVELGSITKSRIIGFGEATTLRGGVFVVYVFEATDEPAKTDRLWAERG